MRKPFYAGAVFGGVLGLVVALCMDLLLGQGIGSGWSEAVAHDLNLLFKTNFPNYHIVVIIGVIAAIGLIGFFGAVIGGLSVTLIDRFFKMLTKEK
jgi:hypothetical protein